MEISSFDPLLLRQTSVGAVLQQPTLFMGSVLDNIAADRPVASH